MTESATRRERRQPVWAACASAVWGGLFAMISLYWALGGLVGIETIGGELERMARAGEVGPLVWGATIIKVVGVVYSLALVQRWGRTLPRALMLAGGWAATVLLLGYGGVTVGIEILVATGVLAAPAEIDWYAFYWHLALWDPWFVLWGILLGLAVVHYQRATRRAGTAGRWCSDSRGASGR
ncbi:DUF3995 domain-containing protein [Saccharomonospora iraqiensis]|uniref:DUF3995 domain-containing protein n=1 Tax=Saccharomonospora iraqiensis TaxID=52698 RepID=UPI0018DBA67F|nr:DUF3995 domain-containing protein [Saccharomonospora iraqiensis]